MAVDTPAKIAIIGGGPIGLEAALYARYLGYEVEVLERNVAGLGTRTFNRQMLTPFRENSSPLGLAAIRSHEPDYQAPDPESRLTDAEWVARYVQPLSATDLIVDGIRRGCYVESIGKVELHKTDVPTGEYDRGNWDFRLRTVGDPSRPFVIADVVLDCSGRFPAFAGHGGLRALGEDSQEISYQVPEVGAHAGKRVLLIGEDTAAAEAAINLTQGPAAAHLTWITRHERTSDCTTPIPIPAGGEAPESLIQLVAEANRLATSNALTWWPGTWLESIEKQQDVWRVQLSGEREEVHDFDALIALTGYRPDWSIASELQLDICPITDAPRPFSKYLLQRPSPHSAEYPAQNAEAMITSEPNYYVLGSKSFGRMPGFLYQHGLRQIRDIFTIIGDRATLDLYAQHQL